MQTQPSLFAQILAHDLRTPITAASEALRLAESAEPKRAKQLRLMANENLKRAEEMVFGLRGFVRAESLRTPAMEVDVGATVAGVVEEVNLSKLGKPAAVCVKGSLGVVYGTDGSVAHTFRNLISNAIGHNLHVNDLLVEVGRIDDEEAGPTFYVKDNGKGIPSDFHKRIFEPFRSTKVCNRESMGLGLALVDSLVSQMGGKVWLESEPGYGATFWFNWPMKQFAWGPESSAPNSQENALKGLVAPRTAKRALPQNGAI